MTKKVLSLLISMCMIIGFMPTITFADTPQETTTADFANSSKVYDSLALLQNGDTSKASWDASTSTLTLNGVDFTTSADTAVTLPQGSTICLLDGSINKIRSTNSTAGLCCGIQGLGAITITGNGELDVYAGQDDITSATESEGIKCEGLYISDCTLKAYGGKTDINNGGVSFGIFSRGKLTITSGNVYAEGNSVSTDDGFGLLVNYNSPSITNFEMTGGTFKALGKGRALYVNGVTSFGHVLPTIKAGDDEASAQIGDIGFNKYACYSYEPVVTEVSDTADFVNHPDNAIALLNAQKTGADDSTWNASTKTLTLKGIDFTTKGTNNTKTTNTQPMSIAIYLPSNTEIILKDGTTNKITCNSTDVTFNKTVLSDGLITISGNGELDIYGGNVYHSNASCSSIGIECGSLAVCGAKLKATCGKSTNPPSDLASFGILCKNKFKITSGSVYADGNDCNAGYGCGIQSGGYDEGNDPISFEITGGAVTAIGKTQAMYVVNDSSIGYSTAKVGDDEASAVPGTYDRQKYVCYTFSSTPPVTPPVTPTANTPSGTSTTDDTPAISSDKLNDVIDDTDKGKTVKTYGNDDVILTKETQEKLNNSGANLEIACNWYTWIINGKTVKTPITVNLTCTKEKDLQKGDILPFSIAYNGDFPFEAKLKVELPGYVKEGTEVYLYKIVDGKRIFQSSAITTGYSATFQRNSASEYVVSTVKPTDLSAGEGVYENVTPLM